MYFNSLAYIFGFLPIVLVVYFALNKRKLILAGKIWLLVVSLYYYSWFNAKYTFYLAFYVLLNYLFYKLIRNNFSEKGKTKAILTVAVITNLAILVYFKYLNFFVDAINAAFSANYTYIQILVPLAISLQTLQQICFLTDSRNDEKVNYSFLDYALFSVFFPQMIVGPIVKHNETIPQFSNLRKKIFNHKNFIIGLTIFLIGFYKKGFLAIPLNSVIFDKIPLIESFSTIDTWIFCIMEYLHAYLDISSYIDMAIGSALMINIELPINFNSPMQAINIRDFWQRWQITFARFMKNYVYVPLKALKPSDFSADCAIVITCLLGGLWQCATACGLVWGFLHGLGLLINKYWEKLNINLPNFAAITITFLFVAYAQMLLRVQNLSQMAELTKKLICFTPFDNLNFNHNLLYITGNNTTREWTLFPLIICVIGVILTVFKVSVEGKDLAKFVRPNLLWSIILAVAIIELIYFYAPPTGFLYYNF